MTRCYGDTTRYYGDMTRYHGVMTSCHGDMTRYHGDMALEWSGVNKGSTVLKNLIQVGSGNSKVQ